MDLVGTEKIIEKKLDDLRITYEQINLEDEDINYFLEIDAKRYIEEFKDVGSIQALMYINVEKETITIFGGNIYRECEKESIMKVINVANSVNNTITYGKIFIDNKGRVIYQNTFPVNDSEKIGTYIKAFIIAVWFFYCEMKKYEAKNE